MSSVKEDVLDVLVEIANDPQTLQKVLDRKIGENERKSIASIISFRASQIHVSAGLLDALVMSEFGVEEINDLKLRQYKEVIEFLVDFQGIN